MPLFDDKRSFEVVAWRRLGLLLVVVHGDPPPDRYLPLARRTQKKFTFLGTLLALFLRSTQHCYRRSSSTMASTDIATDAGEKSIHDLPLDLDLFCPINTVYNMDNHPFESQINGIGEPGYFDRQALVSKVRGFTARRASSVPPLAPPSTPITAQPMMTKADFEVLQPECPSPGSRSTETDWECWGNWGIMTPYSSPVWKSAETTTEEGYQVPGRMTTKEKVLLILDAETDMVSKTIGSLYKQGLFPVQARPDDKIAEALDCAISELSKALIKLYFLVDYHSRETWERPTEDMRASMDYYDNVKMVLRGHDVLGKYVEKTMTMDQLCHFFRFCWSPDTSSTAACGYSFGESGPSDQIVDI